MELHKTWESKEEPEYEFEPNAYDSFMRKHLQHYGYYTGRNQGFGPSFMKYEKWDQTHTYQVAKRNEPEPAQEKEEEEDDNKLQEELLRTTQLVYNYEAGRMVPKLREPRQLYAFTKELGPQTAARWPSDMQVLNTKIKHIRYMPPNPEPMYKPTGMEKNPMVRSEENGGRVVFHYEPRSTFFLKSRVGGSRNGCDTCAVTLQSPDDTTLIFESRFESGNLAKAVQVGEYDYELSMRYDMYTEKHTQWYYFRVSNTRTNVRYRFSIVNFMKSDSLYSTGMKPLMYSEKDALQKKIGWIRSGSDIKYYRNNIKYDTPKGDKPFYSMTWTTEFPQNHDTVYFCHCYPYTYTDLQDYLLELSNDPIKSRICKQRVLCRTVAGNLVYVLTITSPSQKPEDIKHKKAVVLTARVHPGESNSSLMMKGFLDYLTGNSADAKLLRDTFVFKIVPMLNPDGVVVGNYRCSLTGRDLNRNYKTVLKESFPSVWHTKNMIKRLLQERSIIVYCDLHGHSRKPNVFIYGCENRHNPQKRLRERIFPVMMCKNAADKFSFESCKFKMQKSKEGTGRIVIWNYGVMNSYTMEATFGGSTLGKKKGYHFNVYDFELMGYHFCDTLLDYCDPDDTKNNNLLFDLEERMKLEILNKLEKQGLTTDDIDLSDDYLSEVESSDGGSDSSVSDGLPVHLQYMNARSGKKKKRLKTKKDRDKDRLVKDDAKKSLSADQTDKKLGSHPSKQDILLSVVKTGPLVKDYHDSSLRVAPQTMKYSSGVPMRPKSRDERVNNAVSTLNQDGLDAKTAKKSDYLEALTNAYLKNGVLMAPDTAGSTFRYSGGSTGQSNLPFNLEGLCPHHEQTLAAQYMASSMHPAGNEMEDMTPSPVTRQVSISPLDRKPVQRHLVGISAAQQRQQDFLQQEARLQEGRKSGSSSPIKQHPSPFDESRHRESSRRGSASISGKTSTQRLRARVPSATFINYDTFKITKVQSQLGEDLTQGHQDSPVNVNECATDSPTERISPGDINQNAINMQMSSSKNHNTNGSKRSGGRQSRMGMYEEDQDNHMPMKTVSVNDVSDHVGPSMLGIQRPQSIGQDLSSAMQSIRDMRDSVTRTNNQQEPPVNSKSFANHYLTRLIKQTDEDLDDLTDEIKDKIQHEKTLVSDINSQERSPPRDIRRITPRTQTNGASGISPTRNFIDRSQTAPTAEKSSRIVMESRSDSRSKLHDVYIEPNFPESSHKITRSSSATSSGSREGSKDREKKREIPNRAKSAKGNIAASSVDNSNPGGAHPARISLMISHDHQDYDRQTYGRKFLPSSRSVRPPFFKTPNFKKK